MFRPGRDNSKNSSVPAEIFPKTLTSRPRYFQKLLPPGRDTSKVFYCIVVFLIIQGFWNILVWPNILFWPNLSTPFFPKIPKTKWQYFSNLWKSWKLDYFLLDLIHLTFVILKASWSYPRMECLATFVITKLLGRNDGWVSISSFLGTPLFLPVTRRNSLVYVFKKSWGWLLSPPRLLHMCQTNI